MTPGMSAERKLRRGGARPADSVGPIARALRRQTPGPRITREGAARAAARVTDSAWRSGLSDLAYSWADSPFGRLLVAVSRRGLVRVAYPERDPDGQIEELSRLVSPRILESAPATDEVRRELDEYFAGRRTDFDVSVDLRPVQGFTRRVLQATARIPFGSVRTYRDVATRAGNALATRAAGNALGANPIPIVVPCHRVVRTGGGLGGYTGGLDRKEALLRLEGFLPGTARPIG